MQLAGMKYQTHPGEEETCVDRTQLMKGILEGCILKIIESRETYGYDIVSQLQDNGLTEVREGTLYPLLLRLEKKGLITATYKPSPLGPSRKYYTLTGEGHGYLNDFGTVWQEISISVNHIFEGGKSWP